MLPRSLNNKPLTNVWFFLFLAILYGYVLPAYAVQIPQLDTPAGQTTLSAQSMLVQFAQSIPNLMRLVTAIAYVLGMVFVIQGIIHFKHFGESRTMMSHEHSLTKPIMYIAAGTMLLYLPTTVHVGMSTFWTEPNPYAYIEQKDQWGDFLHICFLIVQLIGTISLIRGLIILSQVGGHGSSHQGGLHRGITHIIGGILCINIYQFVQVILVTFGLPSLE